jgi:hypothetical protein
MMRGTAKGKLAKGVIQTSTRRGGDCTDRTQGKHQTGDMVNTCHAVEIL